MFSFKVRPCSRAYSHDWTECPFVHPGENARRRDPRRFHYSCVPCPDFRKGACRRGDACEYAHGVFECWLHPAQYRTRLCKDGTGCARRVCFFAHTSEELRPLYSAAGTGLATAMAAAAAASPRSTSPMDMRSLSPPLPLQLVGPGSPGGSSCGGLSPPMSPSAAAAAAASHPLGAMLGGGGGPPPPLHLPAALATSRLRAALHARDLAAQEEAIQLEADLLAAEYYQLSSQARMVAATKAAAESSAASSPTAAAAGGRRGKEAYASLGLQIPPPLGGAAGGSAGGLDDYYLDSLQRAPNSPLSPSAHRAFSPFSPVSSNGGGGGGGAPTAAGSLRRYNSATFDHLDSRLPIGGNGSGGGGGGGLHGAGALPLSPVSATTAHSAVTAALSARRTASVRRTGSSAASAAADWASPRERERAASPLSGGGGSSRKAGVSGHVEWVSTAVVGGATASMLSPSRRSAEWAYPASRSDWGVEKGSAALPQTPPAAATGGGGGGTAGGGGGHGGGGHAFRRTASLPLKSVLPEEPDLSWVQKLVKEG
eukprot:SM000020S06014  [mRNA]  locus=s20:417069:418889:+ [translate_table: standard]